MIIYYSLHSCIRICLLLLDYSFILYFFLPSLPLWWSCVCHTIYEPYHVYPYYELWSIIQTCYLIHIHTRDLLHYAFLWKNINNDILNTSG
jgi:hypothetical protein